jgi:hypothetical protein
MWSRRNSVGVRSRLSPSTNAWTTDGSMRRPSTSAARRGANACDELLHREGLDDVVVGAELERADAVDLAAARADDDDRSADAFLARGLDHAPAVELGEHQVEHAHLRALVAETCERRSAVGDPDRVEPGGTHVTRHAVGDDLVVLDDQDLRHRVNPWHRARPHG